jgi:hypothetical protein
MMMVLAQPSPVHREVDLGLESGLLQNILKKSSAQLLPCPIIYLVPIDDKLFCERAGVITFSAHNFLRLTIFLTWLSMKLCPPNPGLTDMIKTRSTAVTPSHNPVNIQAEATITSKKLAFDSQILYQ